MTAGINGGCGTANEKHTDTGAENEKITVLYAYTCNDDTFRMLSCFRCGYGEMAEVYTTLFSDGESLVTLAGHIRHGCPTALDIPKDSPTTRFQGLPTTRSETIPPFPARDGWDLTRTARNSRGNGDRSGLRLQRYFQLLRKICIRLLIRDISAERSGFFTCPRTARNIPCRRRSL